MENEAMSMYGTRCELINEWIRKRASMLQYQWGDEVADFIRGGAWAHSVNVKLSAACWRQAHAEALAYLCGQPIPDGNDVLAEVLAWIAIPHSGVEGAGGELPEIIDLDAVVKPISATAMLDF
jgi:hypothetical protein